jgi:SAM-dependent methyltransferase
VALLNWAGFDAAGTEISPEVARFAEATFGVKVYSGRLEDQGFQAGSFDVIVLNDVIEHLPDPEATLRHAAGLLSREGFFMVQTPEYKEHLSHAELQASQDLFLKHMEGNSDEHLFLFSRRSAGGLFSRMGYPCLDFSDPVYSYDMAFVASRAGLPRQDPASIEAALEKHPAGRLVQALLDKAFESKDRWWAIQRLEAKLGLQPGSPR